MIKWAPLKSMLTCALFQQPSLKFSGSSSSTLELSQFINSLHHRPSLYRITPPIDNSEVIFTSGKILKFPINSPISFLFFSSGRTYTLIYLAIWFPSKFLFMREVLIWDNYESHTYTRDEPGFLILCRNGLLIYFPLVHHNENEAHHFMLLTN